MKYFAFLVFLTLIFPTFAAANVKPEFEWHLVNGGPKRTLHVCFHRSLNDQWRAWAQEAVDKWNAQTNETGWAFEVVPFTRETCQVFIVLSDIPEAENGGARFDPLDVLEGQNEQPDGRANGAIVTIDSNLEQTKDWITEDEDTTDGAHDGWSTAEGEGTRDPIDTIMHELSHALRLDHHDDYRPDDPDSDISDPKQPGEHYHELSEADIRQAKESSTAAYQVQQGTVGPSGDKNFEIGRATLDIPPYAFGYWHRDYQIELLEATDIISVPLNVPDDYSHVFDAFGIFADSPVQNDIQVTIAYDESDLRPQEKALETAEGFFPPGLQENTIAVVRYEKQPWDLTPVEIEENPSRWELVEGFELDIENNSVSFSMDKAGYYGLVAIADGKEPSLSQGYTRVVNGNVVGEGRLKKAMFFQDLKYDLLRQLPAFLIGFAAGSAVVLIWCKRKSGTSAKVEGDREGVRDVQ